MNETLRELPDRPSNPMGRQSYLEDGNYQFIQEPTFSAPSLYLPSYNFTQEPNYPMNPFESEHQHYGSQGFSYYYPDYQQFYHQQAMFETQTMNHHYMSQQFTPL